MANKILTAFFAFMMFAFAACSESKVAGGNSSEVGSPELMGTLAFAGSTETTSKEIRVAFARVFCIPIDYDPLTEDSSAYFATTTDSLGNFTFDSIPSGIYNVEAYSDSLAFRETGIQIIADSTQSRKYMMQIVGKLKIFLSDTKDSSAEVSISGSAYRSTETIEDESILVTGLAPDFYDSIQVTVDSTTLKLDNINIEANAITEVVAGIKSYDYTIDLNTSQDGINLTDSLSGFPLYIRLADISDSALQKSLKNASDLEITHKPSDENLTHKPVYGSNNNLIGFWVRVNKLYPQSETQKLIFKWSNLNSETHTQEAEPFSLEDGFIFAWNFDENQDQINNRDFYTSGDNQFKGSLNDIESTSGIVGSAFHFNGKSSFIEVENTAKYAPVQWDDSSSFTVSFWVFAEDTSTSRFLWGKSESEYHFKYQATDRWMFKEFDKSHSDSWYEASIKIPSEDYYKKWVHFTVEKSGNTTTIYRNGVSEKTTIGYNDTDETRYDNGPFIIGARKQKSGTIDRVFKGNIDELTVNKRPLGSEWARLIYENQKSDEYWPK